MFCNKIELKKLLVFWIQLQAFSPLKYGKSSLGTLKLLKLWDKELLPNCLPMSTIRTSVLVFDACSLGLAPNSSESLTPTAIASYVVPVKLEHQLGYFASVALVW